MLESIPDEASYEDIQYHIYVREKVERGLEDSRTGPRHESGRSRAVDGEVAR
jgi:hypothetical protein